MNNRVTITFSRDFVAGDSIGVYYSDPSTQTSGYWTFVWVNGTPGTFQVQIGTPTTTTGEIEAIRFASAWTNSLNGFTVTQPVAGNDNQVQITSQTYHFVNVLAKFADGSTMAIPADYSYVLSTVSTGNKITYEDKLPLNTPTADSKYLWKSVNANEVKTKFNLNDDRIGTLENGPFQLWKNTKQYIANNYVKGSNGNLYKSNTTNTAIDPTTDDGTNWTILQRITKGAGAPNIVNGFYLNSIEEGLISRANVISGGGYVANINSITGDETRYATIAGGYDNLIDGANALENIQAAASSVNGGAHHTIKSSHATINGGSYGTIEGNCQYALISGGTNSTIEENCAYSAIIASDQCALKNGGTTDTSGFRAVLLSSSNSQTSGKNSTLISAIGTTVEKYAESCFAQGDTINIGNLSGGGQYTVAQGSNLNANTNGGNQCGLWGINLNIDGTNNYAYGRNHSANNNITYSTLRGNGCVAPHSATHTHTGRNSSIGNGSNMSLDYNMSHETIGANVISLSLSGSSSYPTMPENSVVDGTINVIGVDVSNGDTHTCEISLTLKRIGSANPIIIYENLSVKSNGLTITTQPALSTTTNGRYKLDVTGEVDKTINWNASFRGHQIVYAQ